MKKEKHPLLPEDHVKLKPILGISPRKYIPALYGAALLIIFFLLFFYPGIRNPGVFVIIKGVPGEAGLFVDGVYAGSVDEHPFVSSGKHELELRLTGYTGRKVSIRLPAPVFLTLIIKPRIPIAPLSFDFQMTDPAAYRREQTALFMNWALTGPSREKYMKPMVLGLAAHRLRQAGYPEQVELMIETAYPAISNWTSAVDWLHAAFLSDNLKPFLEQYPLSVLPLIELYPEEQPPFLAKALERYETLKSSDKTPLLGADYYSSRSYSEIPFQPVRGTSFTAGVTGKQEPPTLTATAYATRQTILPFLIAEREISLSDYARFLNENPQWQPENMQELMDRGLVDDQYLLSWEEDLAANPEGPVRYVSWYAAEAYCEWFTTKIADNGLRAVLPGEYEWEWAALQADAPVDMEGSVWEWCGNGYGFLAPLGGKVDNELLPLKALRGGDNDTAAGTVYISTRAGLYPESCPPHTGFRPIIIQGLPEGSGAE